MNTPQDFSNFKSGFVGIAGAPNAGKSTLMNRLLGEKISITSKKPQTTRNRILGVMHAPDSQIVFIDTPGVHKSKQAFNISIVDTALSAIGDVDIILLLVDISAPDTGSEEFLMQKLEKINKPVILGLNKIDQVKKHEILLHIDKWSKTDLFREIIPISAKHGEQTPLLADKLRELLPQGPPLFPEDVITDLPERFFAAEMVREKVFRLTGQEIPYSTAVTIESFKRKSTITAIEATIHVERSSQKGIIIGKNGTKLKQIGEDARKELEAFLGRKVFLKLFVRVQKNWSTDTRAIRNFGY
jgi:GTP-binding protein Era